MKVTMIRRRTGSPDGIRVALYDAGQTYDLPEELAQVFLRLGDAKPDGLMGKAVKAVSNKAVAVPMNKAATSEVA